MISDTEGLQLVRDLRIIGTGRCGTGYCAKVFGVGHEVVNDHGISSCRRNHLLIERRLFVTTIHVVREPVVCIASLTTISDVSWREFGFEDFTTEDQFKPEERGNRPFRETLEMAIAHYIDWNERCEGLADLRLRVEDISSRHPRDFNTRPHPVLTASGILSCARGPEAMELGIRYGYSC